MTKRTAADNRALEAVVVWRKSDKAAVAAKRDPDAQARRRAGARAYRDTNKLRDAADALLNTSDPP